MKHDFLADLFTPKHNGRGFIHKVELDGISKVADTLITLPTVFGEVNLRSEQYPELVLDVAILHDVYDKVIGYSLCSDKPVTGALNVKYGKAIHDVDYGLVIGVNPFKKVELAFFVDVTDCDDITMVVGDEKTARHTVVSLIEKSKLPIIFE